MVKQCCVSGCRNETFAGCNISFHSFPKNEKLRQKWQQLLQVNIGKYSFVCSHHFKQEDFVISRSRRTLTSDAVPSIFPDNFLKKMNRVKIINNEIINPPFADSNTTNFVISDDDVGFHNYSVKSNENTNKAQGSNTNTYHKIESSLTNSINVIKIFDDYDGNANDVPFSDVNTTDYVVMSDDDDDDEEATTYASHKKSDIFRVRSDTAEPVCGDSKRAELLLGMRKLYNAIVRQMPNLTNKPVAVHFKSRENDKLEYFFASSSESRPKGVAHMKDCDECGSSIRGHMYKCVTCPDHVTCQACEMLGLHAEHVVIRISKPLKTLKATELLHSCCQKLQNEGIDKIYSDESTDSKSRIKKQLITTEERDNTRTTLTKKLNSKKLMTEDYMMPLSYSNAERIGSGKRHMKAPETQKNIKKPKLDLESLIRETFESNEIKIETNETKSEPIEADSENNDTQDKNSYGFSIFPTTKGTLVIESSKLENPTKSEPIEANSEKKDPYNNKSYGFSIFPTTKGTLVIEPSKLEKPATPPVTSNDGCELDYGRYQTFTHVKKKIIFNF